MPRAIACLAVCMQIFLPCQTDIGLYFFHSSVLMLAVHSNYKQNVIVVDMVYFPRSIHVHMHRKGSTATEGQWVAPSMVYLVCEHFPAI